jgi:hypothetical protein
MLLESRQVKVPPVRAVDAGVDSGDVKARNLSSISAALTGTSGRKQRARLRRYVLSVAHILRPGSRVCPSSPKPRASRLVTLDEEMTAVLGDRAPENTERHAQRTPETFITRGVDALPDLHDQEAPDAAKQLGVALGDGICSFDECGRNPGMSTRERARAGNGNHSSNAVQSRITSRRTSGLISALARVTRQ